MLWFVIAGASIIASTLVIVGLLERRDWKRAQMYRLTIDVENGKVEPFKNHF